MISRDVAARFAHAATTSQKPRIRLVIPPGCYSHLALAASLPGSSPGSSLGSLPKSPLSSIAPCNPAWGLPMLAPCPEQPQAFALPFCGRRKTPLQEWPGMRRHQSHRRQLHRLASQTTALSSCPFQTGHSDPSGSVLGRYLREPLWRTVFVPHRLTTILTRCLLGRTIPLLLTAIRSSSRQRRSDRSKPCLRDRIWPVHSSKGPGRARSSGTPSIRQYHQQITFGDVQQGHKHDLRAGSMPGP